MTRPDLVRFPVVGIKGSSSWHIPAPAPFEEEVLCGRPGIREPETLAAADRGAAEQQGAVCRMCIHFEQRRTQ